MSNLSDVHHALLDELELGIVVIDLQRRRVRFANRTARVVLELDGDRLPAEIADPATVRSCVTFATVRGERVFARAKRLRCGDLMLTIANRRDDHVMALLRTGCKLNPREIQVAELIARGLTNKRIAARLGLAQSTVKAYVTNIFCAVAVTSRTELLVALEQFRS
jgi:DNA-binding CsgD family transcriptional regulator